MDDVAVALPVVVRGARQQVLVERVERFWVVEYVEAVDPGFVVSLGYLDFVAKPFNLTPRTMARFHFDQKPHGSGFGASRSHWQVNLWKPGVKNSASASRVPTFFHYHARHINRGLR